MGELFLLGLGIYWLATDTTTALWVIGVIIALILIGALVNGKNGKWRPSGPSERPRVRIDHPHLIDADDYECSVCGRRFSGNRMSCPHCGVRFTGRKTDYEEFDEEEDEWAAWEEEEGW